MVSLRSTIVGTLKDGGLQMYNCFYLQGLEAFSMYQAKCVVILTSCFTWRKCFVIHGESAESNF